MTINEVLNKSIEELRKVNIEEPIMQAKRLLAFVLNEKKEYLLIHGEQELNSDDINKFQGMIERLISGEPIQYILGFQEFMGYNFLVNKDVLIPQPDTEILVEEVLKISKEEDKILDLCTGSGAIAISISLNRKKAKVFGSDISIKALDVAKKNNEKLKANVEFIQSDLFDNIYDKFDVIVSNPPYIETEVIERLSMQVRNEPRIALDGGKDGLDIYRKIIEQAEKNLNKDGYLCLEIGYNQKDAVIELIKKSNKYKDIYSKKDLSGNDRIIICKKEG